MSLGSARVYRVNIRKAQNLAQEFQPIRVPHTEQLSVAGLLTATGGFLDAFTFVGHGHVFANSMTGNVVLLGLAAGTGDRGGIWWHLVPILAFMMGVAVAQFIRLTLQSGPVGRAEQISLWLEISFLSLVALLPHELSHEAIILGIAFVAAVQSTNFTRVKGGGYNSTMTTGDLRRFAETLFRGFVPKRDDKALQQGKTFALICLYFKRCDCWRFFYAPLGQFRSCIPHRCPTVPSAEDLTTSDGP